MQITIPYAPRELQLEIHEQLSKKYGVEKLTVAQLGGIECAKCHY